MSSIRILRVLGKDRELRSLRARSLRKGLNNAGQDSLIACVSAAVVTGNGYLNGWYLFRLLVLPASIIPQGAPIGVIPERFSRESRGVRLRTLPTPVLRLVAAAFAL